MHDRMIFVVNYMTEHQISVLSRFPCLFPLVHVMWSFEKIQLQIGSRHKYSFHLKPSERITAA